MDFWLATAPFGFSPAGFEGLSVLFIVLATLRLTRFVVVDSLGAWMFRDRAAMIAENAESEFRAAAQDFLDSNPPQDEARRAEAALADPNPRTFWGRLFSGLECPYCVGFWIGLAVIGLTLWLQNIPVLAPLWFIFMGGLGLNYIVGHIVERFDG